MNEQIKTTTVTLTPKLPRGLLGTIGVGVLALFLVCLYWAFKYSLSEPPDPNAMPAIGKHILSTVNGMLAANLGAILGVSVAAVYWGLAEPPIGPLQKAAAWIYVGLFLITTGVWWHEKFTEDSSQIVSTIPEICRTGLGIILAIFAIALGVKRTITAERAG